MPLIKQVLTDLSQLSWELGAEYVMSKTLTDPTKVIRLPESFKELTLLVESAYDKLYSVQIMEDYPT